MIKKVLISSLTTFLIVFMGSQLSQAQTVYTFTSAGQTGPVGPTQAQVNTAYTGTNLAGMVTVSGGIQTWVVPATGAYRIEAFGGQGYGTYGGRGAHMSGEFNLNIGDVLKILVGQKAGDYYQYPATTYNHQYGGGGGSFVTSNTNVPYIVAGGGGGSHSTTGFIATSDGQITTSGANGANGSTLGTGGANGSGGTDASSANGGGGLLTNGGGTYGGASFITGGLGGNGNYGRGGFGCGGGTSSYNNYRGGGGGGYSGGGGANNGGSCCPSAGGGGSYNAGLNQVNLAGVQTGDGQILITQLTKPLNNAGVTDILSPVDNCDGLVQNVEVEIRNLGANQITSLEVHWTINNITQTVYNYSGLLDTAKGAGADSAIVNIGTISLTASVTDDIVAWTEMPNNVADSTNADDTSSVSVRGFDFPTVSMFVIPKNTLCFGSPFEFRVNTVTQGSILYQWKINTVNSGAQTTNNRFSPSLMNGDSVNVELLTEYCDTADYSVESNYVTMYLNPVPKLINGSSETDTVLENTSGNYLIPVVSGSTFTWDAVGGTITNPVGNAVSVDWGSAMDTAKIMATEKDAGNCSYTNVRNVVVISVVGVKDENNMIGIGYAYPNPANTTVTIPLVIDGSWNIDLSLYSITGEKVRTLYNGEVSGNREITFAVDDLQNGMYFYKVSTSDGYESVKKLNIKH